MGYCRRFNQLPDRAVVREGMDVPNGVELRQEDGEVVGEVTIERVAWMRVGDVVVYKKDAS